MLVADIQPRLSLVVFSTRLQRVRFCVVPSRLFHEAIGSDASRFLKLHKRSVG